MSPRLSIKEVKTYVRKHYFKCRAEGYGFEHFYMEVKGFVVSKLHQNQP